MSGRRPIFIEGDAAFVPLTQGLVAVIDAEEVPRVEGRLWAALRRGGKTYAGRSVWSNGTSGCELMHRVILDCPKDILVDHADGDGLNNRLSNLRAASRSQNAMNSGAHRDNASGLKGVSWIRKSQKWTAWICANGRRVYLGVFDTSEAAHAAYADAAKKLHGDFARAS